MFICNLTHAIRVLLVSYVISLSLMSPPELVRARIIAFYEIPVLFTSCKATLELERSGMFQFLLPIVRMPLSRPATYLSYSVSTLPTLHLSLPCTSVKILVYVICALQT